MVYPCSLEGPILHETSGDPYLLWLLDQSSKRISTGVSTGSEKLEPVTRVMEPVPTRTVGLNDKKGRQINSKGFSVGTGS